MCGEDSSFQLGKIKFQGTPDSLQGEEGVLLSKRGGGSGTFLSLICWWGDGSFFLTFALQNALQKWMSVFQPNEDFFRRSFLLSSSHSPLTNLAYPKFPQELYAKISSSFHRHRLSSMLRQSVLMVRIRSTKTSDIYSQSPISYRSASPVIFLAHNLLDTDDAHSSFYFCHHQEIINSYSIHESSISREISTANKSSVFIWFFFCLLQG